MFIFVMFLFFFPTPSGLTICVSNQRLKAVPAGDSTGNWRDVYITAWHCQKFTIKDWTSFLLFPPKRHFQWFYLPTLQPPTRLQGFHISPWIVQLLTPPVPAPNFCLFLSQRSLVIFQCLNAF